MKPAQSNLSGCYQARVALGGGWQVWSWGGLEHRGAQSMPCPSLRHHQALKHGRFFVFDSSPAHI